MNHKKMKLTAALMLGLVLTSVNAQTVKDVDGNMYKTVKIGAQTWMAENLKTTKFKDGSLIANVTDNTAWAALTTPAYCWYNNDAIIYKNTYGALYNWYTVNNGKLAPSGWHVPTDAEWSTLTDYVFAPFGPSQNVAKALAATTDWTTSSTTETIGCNLTQNNSTGFSALPGGYCSYDNGKFENFGIFGGWWSTTEDGTGGAWYRYLSHLGYYVFRRNFFEQDGFSIRCVKNN